MGLVNGLCVHIVVKNYVMQQPLQVICSFAFCSDGEGRKRTSSTCSNESLNAGGTPVTPRRVSWRQRIFLRVASPVNRSPSAMQQQGLCGARSPITLPSIIDQGRGCSGSCTRGCMLYSGEVVSPSLSGTSQIGAEHIRHSVNAC